jgi:hypothetical protein
MVVARLSFADLVDSPVTLKEDLYVLELFGVDLLELQDQPLRWNVQWLQMSELSLEITSWAASNVIQFDLPKLRLVRFELVELLLGRCHLNWVLGRALEVKELRASRVHGADLELVPQRGAALHSHGLVYELAHLLDDHVGVLLEAHDEVANGHYGTQVLVLVVEVVAHAVHLRQLANGLDKLVGGARKLRLEEGKPEDLRVNALRKDLADLSLQICVDDVLHVDRVEIVRPRMQHLEALMLDLLFPVSFDVALQEVECRLVRLDRVAEIVFHDGLILPQERANCLDT